MTHVPREQQQAPGSSFHSRATQIVDYSARRSEPSTCTATPAASLRLRISIDATRPALSLTLPSRVNDANCVRIKTPGEQLAKSAPRLPRPRMLALDKSRCLRNCTAAAFAESQTNEAAENIVTTAVLLSLSGRESNKYETLER